MSRLSMFVCFFVTVSKMQPTHPGDQRVSHVVSPLSEDEKNDFTSLFSQVMGSCNTK